MILVRRPLPSWVRQVAQLLPPLVVGGIFLFLISQVDDGGKSEQATCPPMPAMHCVTPAAVVLLPTPTPEISPITIVNLDVEPDVVYQGGQGTLINGVCNNSATPITVKLYMGAQRVGGDPFLAAVVDLAGRDTPEGRLSRTIQPGCFGTEPFTNIVDARLAPGRWQLNLVVEVPGLKAPITKSSPPFEVRAAQ